jgi:hypothetical protein
MQGRKVVVLANVKPGNVRDIKSSGLVRRRTSLPISSAAPASSLPFLAPSALFL